MDVTKIYEYIDSHREDIIRDTLNLISIPSESKNIDEVTSALEFTINRARGMGLYGETLLDNKIGVVELGEGEEVIGVITHVDVVDADENDGWEFPPFKGTVSDGWICGRGAIDDKGPTIACMYALKAIESLELPIYKKIRLIIGTQEEVDWTDMEEYTRKYSLPHYSFTADGEFPITNREKGYVDVRFSFKKHTKGKGDFEIISFNGGQGINSIPPTVTARIKGDYRLLEKYIADYLKIYNEDKIVVKAEGEDLLIKAYGISTHSAFPERGKNAIGILCNFLNTLPLSSNGGEDLVRFIAECSYDDYYGKALGLYSESEYVNGEYMHRTVISPTIIRCEEDNFNIYFNLRTVYGTKKEELINIFNDIDRTYNCSHQTIQYLDPIYVSKDKPFLRAMVESYEEISGFKNEFNLAYGTTYAKAIPNTVSWGPLFPGEKDYCHEVNERIEIESLIKSTKIYAGALAKMALSQESFK